MRVSVWDVRGRPVRVEELDEPFLTVDQASGEFRILIQDFLENWKRISRYCSNPLFHMMLQT